jgi:aryl-alcohol dehydrogenase-like predicted oxidoreductase
MEHRAFGGSLEISVLGIGTWQAGGPRGLNGVWKDVPVERAIEALHAGLDAGMNWIDTAESYGAGHSEKLVGRVLRERNERPLIFTKVTPEPYGTGIKPDQIRRAVEGSLERLGVERIDLYQIHWFESLLPGETKPISVETVWDAMAGLVQEGVVSHIGVSSFTRAEVERCHEIHPVTSVQNEFSLLRRDDRAELLPWLAQHGIGYLCYSPLAGGLLTGSISANTVFDDNDWRSGKLEGYSPLFLAENLPRNLEAVEALETVATTLDCPIAEIALRWALAQRGVTGAILGSSNAKHVAANALAGEGGLTAAALAQIDGVLDEFESNVAQGSAG